MQVYSSNYTPAEEHYMTNGTANLNLKQNIKTKTDRCSISFLANDFLRSLGNLASLLSLIDALDDTNSDSLSHIPDGESSKGRIISESLDAHGLGRNHLDNSRISRLDKFRSIFNFLARSSIDFLEKFSEFTRNMRSVTIEDWSVSSTNLTRVIQHDDLSVERFATLGRIILGITADIPSSDFLDRDVLDVEADIVTWETLYESFVVHFNGFDFSGDIGGSKSDDHAGFDDTGFNTADGDSADTADFVDILERETQGFVGWTDGGLDAVDGFEEGETLGSTSLGLLGPTLEPGHVGGCLNHVLKVSDVSIQVIRHRASQRWERKQPSWDCIQPS
jgi:hypothetical protein